MPSVPRNSPVLESSFRDPSGFVFHRDGEIYRQVNPIYAEHYDLLHESRLYDQLTRQRLLVAHEEEDPALSPGPTPYRIIRPQRIPFVSYPYEWSFSQLKDAALCTLEIQKRALDRGMSLKDCSAYNIQFLHGRPIHIDTLSFERYREGAPWIAYRQFCQHFLAPLALISYRDFRLTRLLTTYIDGVPLDLASRLLPFRTRLSFSLQIHIHLHASAQRRYQDGPARVRRRKMPLVSLRGFIDSLEASIRRLSWKPAATEWAEYYEDTNYSTEAHEHKKQLVGEFLAALGPSTVWDLGSNDGTFSRIAGDREIMTVSFDVDPAAVDKNYLTVRRRNEEHLLPLLLDLTNPSTGIGWGGSERMSLVERGPADTVLALALVHHLAISNNVPLPKIARFFSMICNSLIIEFVPKSDSQVQRLLSTREDIFPEYTPHHFEEAFGECFSIDRRVPITSSQRTLYLLRRTS